MVWFFFSVSFFFLVSILSLHRRNGEKKKASSAVFSSICSYSSSLGFLLCSDARWVSPYLSLY